MNDMATIEMPPMTEQEELSIPLDLSVWVPAAQLRDWIMTDVARLNWTNADLLELLRKQPDFEPKALLNTMTFAYATGVFSAEEITRRCSEEPEFKAVRPKLPPRIKELKRFRKENRGLFKWCLAQVITRALKTQFIEGDEIDRVPPGLRHYVAENATERLDLARHMDRSVDLL
jgi:transposase